SRDRIEPRDREIIAHVFPRGGEEILENQRQRQKARPGIEFEWEIIRAIRVRYCPEIELSAHASVLFQQRDADAAPCQMDGGGEPADAAADDHRGFRHFRAGLYAGTGWCKRPF